MRYQIGDIVLIKNLEWYKSQGDYVPSWLCPCCGRVMTIDMVYTEGYAMKEVQGVLFQDRMIEGLAQGLTQEEFAEHWANFDFNKIMNDIIRKRREENMKRKEQTLEEAMLHNGVVCPEGYEFKDENGNVIEAKKIVLDKKKYPKTYNDCVIYNREGTSFNRGIMLSKLEKLLICREAYWEIAGKDLGLNKRWEPSYANGYCSYAIIRHTGHIRKSRPCANSVLLEFPTEEMRDAFYENFKDLIEECKELL